MRAIRTRASLAPAGKIERRVARYSEVDWRALAERLADLGGLLESALGGPQDVEGAVVGDELWVLQSGLAPDPGGKSWSRRRPCSGSSTARSKATRPCSASRASSSSRPGWAPSSIPESVDDALFLWRFVPRTSERHLVHLPRRWNVLSSVDREQVVDFASALRGRARGLVVHDHLEWSERQRELRHALGEMDRALGKTPGAPPVFLEYAAGLELDTFAALIEAAAPLLRISACIDTGHVALFSARQRLEAKRPGLDALGLEPDHPALAELLPLLDQTAEEVRGDVASLVGRLGRMGKPLHFHLHDGHLLSRHSVYFAEYGVRDHVSFHQPIPVPTWVSPSGQLPTLLGEAGLRRVLGAAFAHVQSLSFTLEIHPTRARLRKPLGEHAPLFAQWTSIGRAEMMHHWLGVLVEEHAWVRRLCAELRQGNVP